MRYGDLSRGSRDLSGAVGRLQILQWLGGNLPHPFEISVLLHQALDDPNGPAATFSIYGGNPTANAPAWLWVVPQGSTTTYLFIAGCATMQQGTDCWSGYKGNIFGFNGIGQVNRENLWFRQAWNAIWAVASTTPALVNAMNHPIYACGHSAGGCIAKYAIDQNLMTYNQPLYPSQLIVFGSPSCGFPSFYQSISTLAAGAFFLSDDPVPLIPPPLTFAQRWWADLTYGQANRVAMFVGWPSTMQVDLSGNFTAVSSPSQVGPNPVGSIQSWLANTASGVQTSHSVDTYAARFASVLPALPAQPVNPGPILPVPPPPNVTTAQVNAIVNAATQTSFQRSDIQNENPVIIPPVQLFTVERVGHVYYVMFGGATVATGPHRRGAHQLARQGNAFLRSMQSRGGVDTAAMEAQFGEYLAAATDPTQGFQPVMIDGL